MQTQFNGPPRRPADLQNVQLSHWTYSTSLDPQLFLEGKKLMIIPEKKLPRDKFGKVQFRVPENYSDKAIVVRELHGKREVLAIYYLHIIDPNGKRVMLRTDIVMPTP